MFLNCKIALLSVIKVIGRKSDLQHYLLERVNVVLLKLLEELLPWLVVGI